MPASLTGSWAFHSRRRRAVAAALFVIAPFSYGGDVSQAGDSPPKRAPASASSANEKGRTNGDVKNDAEADSPVLKRILENWKARQERTRSFHFRWKELLSFGQAAEDRTYGRNPTKPEDADYSIVQMNYWLDEKVRFRLERKLVKVHGRGAPAVAVSQEAFDGTSHTSIEGLDSSTRLPLGTIGLGDQRRREKGVFALDPFWLTFRAFDPIGDVWRPEQFRLITENAVIDKLHCTKIQRVGAGGRWVDNCWVDPARDDVVVRFERETNGQLTEQISIQYQIDKPDGWVPARWTRYQQGSFAEGTVTAFTMNEKFPASTFAIKFPPGTMVGDQTIDEQYVVAKDGSKADVQRFESRLSLYIQNALETAADFQIEPQPLRDAIQFVHSRYNIPILIDEKGFREASIEQSLEVDCRTPGIKVRELLKTLLARSPKPIGFRVENEVLQISPRFAGKQPTHKPRDPPPKVQSAKAREIQKALESPVDFDIQPQPLKDAINFIRSRYIIPVVIDEKGFRDASIELNTEVSANVPGIKLRSLLAILLQQCPKPVGFKIENDALRIAPIAAAK